jgi:hypothetical protein
MFSLPSSKLVDPDITHGATSGGWGRGDGVVRQLHLARRPVRHPGGRCGAEVRRRPRHQERADSGPTRLMAAAKSPPRFGPRPLRLRPGRNRAPQQRFGHSALRLDHRTRPAALASTASGHRTARRPRRQAPRHDRRRPLRLPVRAVGWPHRIADDTDQPRVENALSTAAEWVG